MPGPVIGNKMGTKTGTSPHTQRERGRSPALNTRRVAVLLVAVCLLVNGYGLMWGQPNPWDWAVDSVVPEGPLVHQGSDLVEITAKRYPPFHFYLLKAAFLPARRLAKMRYFAERVKMSSMLYIMTARLLSVAMGTGAALLVYFAALRCLGLPGATVAALIFALSPVTLYYSHNANLDMPYVFWLAAALLMYMRIMEDPRPIFYLLLALFAAFAVCTKDQAYAFVAGVPLAIGCRLIRGRGSRNRREWRAAFGAVGLFVLALVLIQNVLFDFAGFRDHVRTILGPASECWQEYERSVSGHLRLVAETVLHLADAVGWPALLLCAAGIGWAATGRPAGRKVLRSLVPAASYYVCFLAVVLYVYPRFVLPMLVPLSLCGGAAAERLLAGGRRRWAAGLIASVLLWEGLCGLSVDRALANDTRYAAQRWIERNIPITARVRIFQYMRDLPRLNRTELDVAEIEQDAAALAASGADYLVVSFAKGQALSGVTQWGIGARLRTMLGDWGKVPPDAEGGDPHPFWPHLLHGRLGFEEVVRFRPPLAWFTPHVASSLERVVVILRRKQAPRTHRGTHRPSGNPSPAG